LTVVLDTNVVVALYDAGDPDHALVADWVTTLDEDLVATPLAVAEMDYLVHRRGGKDAREVLWGDLDAGAYLVRWWADALNETLRIARRYPFAGLTHASLVALAGLLRTRRIATVDQHFRSMTTSAGEPFVLLPDDA
jgi:predicted nucleic acid-binding protein